MTVMDIYEFYMNCEIKFLTLILNLGMLLLFCFNISGQTYILKICNLTLFSLKL